jgi:integrase/transcriptional regulator with XRE-family HTH domain
MVGGAMTIINDFKHLQNFRYHVKLCHNVDGNGDSWRLMEDTAERQMNLSYQEVIEFRKHDILGSETTHGSSEVQIFRNHLTSLHSYLAFYGKTDDSPVGREMQSAFDEKLRAYLDSVDVAERTKSDRRSHLRAWNQAVATLLQQPAEKSIATARVPASDSDFHKLLREAIAASGYAPKTLAKRAGASTSAIQRWLKGAVPNRRAYPSVHRIEAELGLERDALLSHVRAESAQCESERSPASIAYRQRQRENSKAVYRLSTEQVSSAFLEEWNAYYEYKTSRSPLLERLTRGSWRMLPVDKIVEEVPSYARRGNRGCVTATMTMEKFRSFFGYLSRPKAEGGLGIALDEAQSLAWLSVPEAIDGYLTFMSDRSDGLIHSGHAVFCSLGASMTHPRTGYLTQQPAFASKIPDRYTRGTWADACARAHRLFRLWAKDAKDTSRKPYEPIQGLLNLSEPLAPIIRAVNQLDKLAAEAAGGSLQEAIYKRDALLLSILMANPLRARNCILATWHEDGTGSLYQRENGQWRIRFGAGDFKTDRHALQTDYDAPFPAYLNERIEEYLLEYRPRLLRKNPRGKFLFPGKTGRCWKCLNKQVFTITGRLIPETPGFGPHAIRHIVATDWLRKHPNDFLTAAQLLHDRLETVLKDYAHLRQDDAFTRFEAHLEAVGRAMKS